MRTDRFSLASLVALVTGASSGLGRHLAKVLAASGANVVVTARREEKLLELVDEIADCGGRACAVPMDVTDEVSIVEAFDQTEAAFGTVDVLVNNAGIGDPRAFLDTDDAAWNAMMDTNLKSAWRISREATQRLVTAGKGGSIINIASIFGLRVGDRLSHYAVAKAGVVQLTRALAVELARYSIRVNAIAPGYFGTEMTEDFFSTEKGQAYIQQKVPMRRLGTPEELSGPLLLLASAAGAFMTGAIIPVEGGHSNNSL